MKGQRFLEMGQMSWAQVIEQVSEALRQQYQNGEYHIIVGHS